MVSSFAGPRVIRVLAIIGICREMFAAGFGFVGYQLREFRRPTMEQWSRLHVGDSEDVVRSLLGQPFRDYQCGSAPADYYVQGYRSRHRPIVAKVLIDMGHDLVLYVWVNESAGVEDHFFGVS